MILLKNFFDLYCELKLIIEVGGEKERSMDGLPINNGQCHWLDCHGSSTQSLPDGIDLSSNGLSLFCKYVPDKEREKRGKQEEHGDESP